jgi:hypothetical protein
VKLCSAAAKELLPDLREPVTDRKNEKDFPEDYKNKTAAVGEAIQAIEAVTTQPELRSIEPRLPKANRGE